MAEERKIVIDIDVESGDALKRLDKLEAAMFRTQENAAEMAEKMEKGFEAAGKGAKGAAKGVKGVDTSIGGLLKSLGLIAVAMEIFMFLKDLLMKNQKVADTLAIAFKAIEVLFGMLTDAIKPMGKVLMDAFENPQQALEDLWSAIKTNFLNRIKGISVAAEAMGKVIKGAFSMDWDLVTDGMKQYGQALIQVSSGLDIEQQNNFVNGIVEAGTEALNTATKIQELTNAVKLAEAQQGLLMLEYQREAELQRQIRDDVSLTIAERQAANKELGDILDRQSKDELALSDQRLELSLLEQSINKDSIDAEVEVINARKEIADINERITGQRSEQLTNENGLIQENIDKIKAQADVDAEAAALRKARVLDLEQQLADSRIALIQNEELRRITEVEARRDRLIEEITEDDAVARELKENLRQLAQAELNAIEDESLAKELARLEEAAKKKKAILDKEKADVKKTEEAKQEYRQAGLSAASSIVGSLGQLAGLMAKQGDESVALQKTLAIAQVAINTAQAISAGIAGATTSATATGPGAFVATPIFIATTIATILGSLAQVGTILAGVPGPSAGGAISGASANIPAAAAPNISAAATTSTELGGAEQAQLAPIQAFVVETEMTGNQQNISQIENQVTFGIDG
jgi:hypothetical protein